MLLSLHRELVFAVVPLTLGTLQRVSSGKNLGCNDIKISRFNNTPILKTNTHTKDKLKAKKKVQTAFMEPQLNFEGYKMCQKVL